MVVYSLIYDIFILHVTSERTKRHRSHPYDHLMNPPESWNRWCAGRDVCHFCLGVLSKKQLEDSTHLHNRGSIHVVGHSTESSTDQLVFFNKPPAPLPGVASPRLDL